MLPKLLDTDTVALLTIKRLVTNGVIDYSLTDGTSESAAS